MRRVVQLLAVATSLAAGGPALAQTGFYLPAAVPSSGQDEFRAADGTTCRSTMDGTRRLELGTYGSAGRSENSQGYGLPSYYGTPPVNGNAGVYGRFTMSLDARPNRIDCNKLFALELERRQLEVEIMKRSLASTDRKLDEAKAAAPAPASRKPTRLVRNAPPP